MNWLNNNSGMISLFSAAIAFLSFISVLWISSSFHEIGKINKIKIAKFNARLKDKIYPTSLEIYLQYQRDTKGDKACDNYVSIQDYMKWNGTISNLHTQYRIIYNNFDASLHASEIEFFDWLKTEGIIKGYCAPVWSKDGMFFYYEYILTVSNATWNKIQEEYEKSTEYLVERKLWLDMYNAMWRESPDEIMLESEINAENNGQDCDCISHNYNFVWNYFKENKLRNGN